MNFFLKIFLLNNTFKLLIAISADTATLILCYLLSFALRYENFGFLENTDIFLLLPLIVPVTIALFIKSNFYQATIRFISFKTFKSSLLGIIVCSILILLISQSLKIPVPRSVPFIFMIMFFLSVNGKRFILKYIYTVVTKKNSKKVAIYGSNSKGLQLLNALINNQNYNPIFFIEKNFHNSWKEIGGLEIVKLKDAAKNLQKHGIDIVLISLPHTSIKERSEIVNELQKCNVEVKVVPSITDLIENKVSIKDLPNIDIEDLLGRDIIPPKEHLMTKNIKNKVVMVTGSGGSIGSELTKQIINIKPNILILVDFSEYSLYRIDETLKETLKNDNSNIEIIPILGNVLDLELLKNIFMNFNIDIIFHVAAYKHVPMIEHNIVSGIKNNVFGTLNLVKYSIEYQVKNFILVSTDKSVRPTNFMGASKRLAEIICQSYDTKQNTTKFSIVRFGNVVGSSGSVFSIFKNQIKNGGPITVTHKDVTRYFMTISEAAQLVIQASSMAKGGDIFLLDMGEPVKILDFAKKMANLSGLKPYMLDDQNPEGDIAIEISGLRPGEKLYEELLISNNPQGTEHKRIWVAHEKFLSFEDLQILLKKLNICIKNYDVVEIQNLLKTYLEDFKKSKVGNDHLNKIKKDKILKLFK